MPSSELSMVFCYVYVIRSHVTGEIYIGLTKNVRRRFAEHNQGLNFSTKPGRPWKLVYYEAHTSFEDAKRREKYLKTTAGDRALRKMLRFGVFARKNLIDRKSTTRYA